MMDNEELLLSLNTKLDDILKLLTDLTEKLTETAEIASVFKEFGALMSQGQVPTSVPMLST